MIVIVDDEPLIRALIVDALEDLGHEIVEAGDGPEGLKALETAGSVDLLITDIGLPAGMNGRQLADAAREQRADLKVLFITGYADPSLPGHDLDPGMDIISKPFELDALASKVEEMIAA